MTLDVLKSEALKLGKSELFDFAQFIIGALKERDDKEGQATFELSAVQKEQLASRLADVQNNPAAILSGVEAEQQLIKKYALDV